MVNKKPNFFVIGAPKCGTSSVCNWLGQHPQVFMPSMKEPHFFNSNDQLCLTRNIREYERLYKGVTQNHQAVGDGSTWYLYAPEAVRNIEAYTDKKAKYIVCLRNPVDMAWSLHSEMYINGNEPVASFGKAWRLQEERAQEAARLPLSIAPSHLQYRKSCALGSMLERLYQQVPRARVLVVFLEDMSSRPAAVFHRILEFLELDSRADSVNFNTLNTAKHPRSALVTKTITVIAALKRSLGMTVGFGLLKTMKRLNTLHISRPRLSSEIRDAVTSSFAGEIRQIEQLTGRDLEHWRF